MVGPARQGLLRRVQAGARLLAVAGAITAAPLCAATVRAAPMAAPCGNQSPPAARVHPLPADPFHNPGSSHQTEVEASAAVSPQGTVVSAFQVGRYRNGGGSRDIGTASTTDGCSWSFRFVPNLTVDSGGKYNRVTDATVAYDVKHQSWLLGSLGFDGEDGGKQAILVNRSSDAQNWKPQDAVFATKTESIDKPWIGCDNNPQSSDFGNCYTTFDYVSRNDEVAVSRSQDGGASWSRPAFVQGGVHGLGGEPVVLPSGRVVIPLLDEFGISIDIITSDDGGNTFHNAASIPLNAFGEGTDVGLRSDPLPSVAMDANGRVYVTWSDCGREGRTVYGVSYCTGEDLMLSHSDDGEHWSSPQKIPTGGPTPRYESVIPAIAVDPATAGDTAKIAVSYYAIPDSHCDAPDAALPVHAKPCRMASAVVTSADGGRSWSKPQYLSRYSRIADYAPTDQGHMAGDYGAIAVFDGSAYPIFPVAKPLAGHRFHQTMNVVSVGIGF